MKDRPRSSSYISGNLLQHSTCQATRDLLWVINSPALLVSNQDVDCLTPAPRDLLQSQIDTGHLNKYLRQRHSCRVGRYFESLIAYWLRHIRCVEIVAESKTIYEDHRSVGEIDFIFYDEQKCLTHWEVAVKFYLCRFSRGATLGQFIGPNARDTLEQKRQKMFKQQLPLSRKHFPEVAIRCAFLKGRLFYHSKDQLTANASKYISSDHLSGGWCRISELVLRLQTLPARTEDPQPPLHDRPAVRFRLLEKPFWLADAITAKNDETLMTCESLLDMASKHFRVSTRCLLVSQMRQEGDSSCEVDRFFIVSETWPEVSGDR
ncbi:MAG: DUF1853 family protein [Rubripirellula sp.]|nr:DUF1853 family protein [Rubripirellula sp.]